MTVYLDVVFFVNFLFDAEILLALFAMSPKHVPLPRLLFSACVGGLSAVLVFIPYFNTAAIPPVRVLLPFLMVFIAIFPCRTSEILKYGTFFMIMSFVLSGMMNFFKIKTAAGLLPAAFVYLLIFLKRRFLVRRRRKTQILYKNKKVTVNGFYDSGNNAEYLGMPVILANREVFAMLFGEDFDFNTPEEWADCRDICAVPYQTVGKCGVIMGVKVAAKIGGKKYDKVVLGYFKDNLDEKLILNGMM